MTIVLGLRCRDGVVLGSDSQRTEGRFREQITKLFRTRHSIVWGCAGSIAIQQELFAALEDLVLPVRPSRKDARDALVGAVASAVRSATASIESPSPAALSVAALFAWYSADEQRTFLLRVHGDGYAEFAPRYTAVGGPSNVARFAFRQSEHLEYATLPLDPGQMIVAKIADEVISASTDLVGPPVQLAVVSATGATILDSLQVRALEDSVAAFRERQREFLVSELPRDSGTDTGLRP